jgi:adenosyl cobinamide kinase/adenosyl cobinamide phosphate guanylyltransferase
MSLALLIGGARSGKSRLATDFAARSGRPVVVIATGEPRDEEMAARIARHRAERPSEWETLEEPVHLEKALERAPMGAYAIVDCLTLWVSNLIEQGMTDDEVLARARDASGVAARRSGPVVAVTNDVGAGVVPTHPLGRRFRDVLGAVNTIWADAAVRSLYVVAGKLLPLQGADALLDD